MTKVEYIQGIPAFRDFTICDPHYFVILFWALFHNFEEKIQIPFFFAEKKQVNRFYQMVFIRSS